LGCLSVMTMPSDAFRQMDLEGQEAIRYPLIEFRAERFRHHPHNLVADRGKRGIDDHGDRPVSERGADVSSLQIITGRCLSESLRAAAIAPSMPPPAT
jgi:hypothetical protein